MAKTYTYVVTSDHHGDLDQAIKDYPEPIVKLGNRPEKMNAYALFSSKPPSYFMLIYRPNPSEIEKIGGNIVFGVSSSDIKHNQKILVDLENLLKVRVREFSDEEEAKAFAEYVGKVFQRFANDPKRAIEIFQPRKRISYPFSSSNN